MSDNKRAKRNKNKTAEERIDHPNASWGERHFASIMGGGAFVLLAFVAILMYVANN